jgi:hypothetical protein
VDHPLPWLRYLDADDMDDDAIDFDDIDVESPSGEHLGNVDGFIVDSHSGRPYYVVVDSGGWFKSKHFLIPVGHIRFNADDESLVADIGRDRIDRFPGFDKDEFARLSLDDLKRLNDATCAACSIEGVSIVYAASEPMSAAWDRPDFQYPDWWRAQPSLPDRMGDKAVTTGAENPPTPVARPERSEAERVVARAADPSPHFDGRAQPGDVIGVETGGEQTRVGDTAEDENKRRREAEETNRKLRNDSRDEKNRT